MRRFLLTAIGSFLMCLGAVASDTWVVNSSGDTIWYEFRDKHARVTYKGKYSDSYQNEYSKSVVIPEEVTYKDVTYSVLVIGDRAFEACDELTSVVLPNSMRLIDSYAFSKCLALKSVSIPDGVLYIGNGVFSGCRSLTDVTLPKGTKKIGSAAFHGCVALKSITIPDSVKEIKGEAFKNCTSLANVSISDGVRVIGCDAFSKCVALKNVSIPDNVLYIESGAFSGCRSLTDVTLPKGTKKIGSAAFHSCVALKSITIPDSVKEIEREAFKYCTSLANVSISDRVRVIGRDAFSECGSLTSITIPKGVTEIDPDAFDMCIRLQNITVAKGNPNYSSEDGVLFDKPKTKLILCPCGKSGFYRIPEGVQEVERGAFVCYGLMSITIPKSMKIMGAGFKKCDKLREVYNLSDLSMEIDADQANVYTSVPSVSHFKVLGDYVFYERNDSTIELLGYKGEAKSITLPSDCKGKKYTIAEMAFFAGGMTDVTIPGCVSEVGEGAFAKCGALKNVVMKEGVRKIGLFAFSDCPALKNVTIPSTVCDIRRGVFDECVGLTNVNVTKGNPNYSSENGVLFNGDKTELILYPSAKKGAYKIPNGVTQMESNAFENCVGLTSVTLSSNMKRISLAAFKNCTGLKSVVIPKNVNSIGYVAFLNCTGLTRVTIPDGVDDIDMAAFEGCSSLESVTIPSGVRKLGISVFSDCTGLKSITCKSVTPPEVTWCTFENVDRNIPVYVPEKSVERYKSDQYWGAFKNIEGKSFSTPKAGEKKEQSVEFVIPGR
ncbi:MAG: leucine-rich repeat domain-containing protein [Paludibacteraceae bacterium]|nr:leucine-rich repeat domain-containing protein [Paludibacteraceae bacterium]